MKKDEGMRDQRSSTDPLEVDELSDMTSAVPPPSAREAQNAHENHGKPGLFSERERAVRREREKEVDQDARVSGDSVWPQKKVGGTDTRPETGAADNDTIKIEKGKITTFIKVKERDQNTGNFKLISQ